MFLANNSCHVLALQEASTLDTPHGRAFLAAHNLIAHFDNTSTLCILAKGKPRHGTCIKELCQHSEACGAYMGCEVVFGEIAPDAPRLGKEQSGPINRAGRKTLRIVTAHLHNDEAKKPGIMSVFFFKFFRTVAYYRIDAICMDANLAGQRIFKKQEFAHFKHSVLMCFLKDVLERINEKLEPHERVHAAVFDNNTPEEHEEHRGNSNMGNNKRQAFDCCFIIYLSYGKNRLSQAHRHQLKAFLDSQDWPLVRGKSLEFRRRLQADPTYTKEAYIAEVKSRYLDDNGQVRKGAMGIPDYVFSVNQ